MDCKSTINSLRIQKNFTFRETDVLQVNIHNYTGTEAKLIMNGVTRPLPPPQKVEGTDVPVAFIIENRLCAFDIEFTIEFSGPTGNVVIDYSKQIKTC